MWSGIRARYESAVMPLGKLMAKTGLTANTLTILSLVPAFAAFWSYYNNALAMASLFLIGTGLMDMLDGAIARATGTASRFGAVLDHVVDRYAEFLIITGITIGRYAGWLVGIAALFSMLMASFTRAKAESVGGLKSCAVGIAERKEKFAALFLGSIAEMAFPGALAYALIAVVVISQITVVQRLAYARAQIMGGLG